MNLNKVQRLESERLYDELETLVDIGKALTSHLSLDDVYQVVMEKVRHLLCPKAWSLLMVDQESGVLNYEIVVSPAAEQLRGTWLQPGEGIVGWVAGNGLPLLVSDVKNDPLFSRQVEQRIGFEVYSVVCVPLVSNNRIIGVIQLFNGAAEGPFIEEDQRILATIADFTAIAIENSRLVEKVRELTITDDLTGLYNSRHFQGLCKYEMERSVRYGLPLSLVFLDLDHFKLVNDNYGHVTGSRLLKEVGQLFLANTRNVDHVARYGGDEFVFLLPSAKKEGALTMGTYLLEALRQAEFFSDCGQPIKVTASLGVSTYPTNAENLEELVRVADEAMYVVKNSTRNDIKSA